MNKPPVVYVASQSPRRRELLALIGVTPELLLPGADEDAEALEAERPGEPPEAYVQRVTRAKLQAARARRGGAVPAGYRFRGVRPAFHFDALSLQGAGDGVATVNGDGLVCMQAVMDWG